MPREAQSPPSATGPPTAAPYGNPRCARRKNGPALQRGERGAWKGVLRGTTSSVSGKGDVSIIFGAISIPGFSFVSPFLALHWYGRLFPGMEHYHPTGDYICASPVIFSVHTYSGTYNTAAVVGTWYNSK